MYRSLYRRWRPSKLKEVVGQEHITRTLSHALIRNTVAHAYLFCGPRGTGKTSTAKILARAVNCANPAEGEPCGECKICLSISSGSSMDVMELDAASNRGIDEVRDLREKTRYAPSQGKYKVYIIDEVHMLTNEAFNALLKTLEEPPPGVVFILATTEPSRLPPTVISRCQRFDFRLLTLDEIINFLKEIVRGEGWEFEEEALPIIARLSGGALRDALGLLEQASAYGEGRIMAESVYEFTGLAGEDTIGRIAEALAREDAAGGLAAVQDIIYGGKDVQLFVKEQMYFFSRLLAAHTSGAIPDEIIQEKRYVPHISRYKDSFSRDSLLEIISLLHQTSVEVRFSQYAHFNLEIAFLKMLRAVRFGRAPLMDSALRRLALLEEKLDGMAAEGEVAAGSRGKNLKTEAGASGKEAVSHDEPPREPAPDTLKRKEYPSDGFLKSKPEKEPQEEPVSDLWIRLQQSWPKILDSLKKTQVSTHAWLEPAQLQELNEDTLVLSYAGEYSIHKVRIMETNRRRIVEKAIQDTLGKAVYLKCITGDEAEKEETNRALSGGESDFLHEEPESSGGKEFYEDDPDDEVLMQEALKLFRGKVLESDR